MRAQGQQLQYGNRVLKLSIIQRKVLFMCVVRAWVRVCACVGMIYGTTRRQHVVARKNGGEHGGWWVGGTKG